MKEYKVKHKKSTPYHPQANGQVESTKKVIEGIITKTIHLHRRDWALQFDSKFKDFQGKFQTHWLGPYEIDKVFSNGVVRIKTIDEFQTPLILNGHRLKIYHKPLSKEEFVKIFQDSSAIRPVKKNSSSTPT